MTVTTNPGLIVSVLALANTVKSRFIRPDGAVATANQRAIGVSNDEVSAGDVIPVITSGIVLVESGAAVAVNDVVTSDATGRAIVAGSNPVNGIAFDAATGAGEFIRIKIL